MLPTTLESLQDGMCGKYAAEVIFLLFKIAESMLDPSMRLYIYQAMCFDVYGRNSTVCEQVHPNKDQEEVIQQLSAQYIMVYKIILNAPVMVLGLFCGAWSDHIGRKLPVAVACAGAILAVLLFMSSQFDGAPIIALVLVGAGLRGMFGKSAVVSMALHSYITDISTRDERTERLGLLLGMNFLGYFMGSLLTGVMLQYASFSAVFVVAIVIYSVCVAIALACMRASLPEDVNDVTHAQSPPKVRNPFNLSHVRESLSVIFRRRTEHDRFYLWYFFLCINGQQLTKSGEIDITLLFTKRSPLNWSKGLYGYLLATDYAALAFSVLVLLPLLARFLRPHDVSLVAFGFFFKVLRLLILTFANETWLVFLSVVIGLPSGMIVSSCKSLISKLVCEDEIGKIFSLLTCVESMSNLVGSVIFTQVYTATTFRLFSGFTYAMDALFYFLLVGTTLLVWQDMKHFSSKYYLLQEINHVKTYGSTKSDIPYQEGTENKGFIMPGEALDSVSDNNDHRDKYDIFRGSELSPLDETKERLPNEGKETEQLE